MDHGLGLDKPFRSRLNLSQTDNHMHSTINLGNIELLLIQYMPLRRPVLYL